MEDSITYYTYYLIIGKSQLSNAKYYRDRLECLQDALEQRKELKKVGYEFNRIIIKKHLFQNIATEIDHIYLYGEEAKKVVERRANNGININSWKKEKQRRKRV